MADTTPAASTEIKEQEVKVDGKDIIMQSVLETNAMGNVTAEETLPKLSVADFHGYNRMAEEMDMFHNHFRSTWTSLLKSLKAKPRSTPVRQILSTALQFCHHLDTHHSIEERHIFPVLAERMPAFQNKKEMLSQHAQIHAGLDKFQVWVEEARDGKRDFVAYEMIELMESFGGVLWEHLDEEVRQLGAENMRKYWSVREIRNMPM